ncbi:MAG: diaminopimelate epimerase [Gammaproteobacteria bacterium]|nr:diaminopimelate epimerase [Gammaproteobacteria bacterium]
MELNFTKMHGLGNDFIVINNLNGNIQLTKEQIQFMGDRHFGIGFDQLLMIEETNLENTDFKYRIFNADGNEVEQCGNGARCFAYYVRKKRLCDKDTIIVETKKSIISLYYDQNNITVNMGEPKFNQSDIPMLTHGYSFDDQKSIYIIQRDLDNNTIQFSAVSMGNPHISIVVNDVDNFPVQYWGKYLVHDSLFPEGVNVGFMEIVSNTEIKLRVYERGVGETLACGTGACAAVVNGIQQGVLASQVKVQLPGGMLDIEWQGTHFPVWMKGGAEMVYEGKIIL